MGEVRGAACSVHVEKNGADGKGSGKGYSTLFLPLHCPLHLLLSIKFAADLHSTTLCRLETLPVAANNTAWVIEAVSAQEWFGDRLCGRHVE